MFNVKISGTSVNHILKLSQPGISHNGSKDRGQVAESHKSVIDGSGQVIVPVQEVPEVQHQHRCGQAGHQTLFKSKTQLWNIYLQSEWNIQILLTSHSIVGETLTEFIDNNEEDAERVATYHFTLMDYRKSSIVFTNGDSVQTIHIHMNETYKYSSIAKKWFHP